MIRVFDKDGYDDKGFNEKGIHRDTGTEYNPEGYDVNGKQKNVINIPEFLRKNRDAKYVEVTDEKELNIDFDKYSDEELLKMENELDTELEHLEVQENELKERKEKEKYEKLKNEIIDCLTKRKELIEKYRELQKELGESGDEIEIPNLDYDDFGEYDEVEYEELDSEKQVNNAGENFEQMLAQAEKSDEDFSMKKVNITHFETLERFEENCKNLSYDDLIYESQFLMDEDTEINNIISHLQYRIEEKEKERIARREAILSRVNEKIEKKRNLEKSINDLNKNFED